MSMNTVLLLDLEPNSIEETRRPLEEAGFHVSVARDGEEGLLSFRHMAPDLVIIEPMLPGTNGFEVCRTIKESPGGAATPVIALTGYYSAADYETRAVEEYGFDQFLEKPVPGARLVATCCRLLSTAQAQQQAGPAPHEPTAEIQQVPAATADSADQPAADDDPTTNEPEESGGKLREVDPAVLAPPPVKRRRTLGGVLLRPRKVWGAIALFIVAGFLTGMGLAEEIVGGEGGFSLPSIHWMGDFVGPPRGADLFGPYGLDEQEALRNEMEFSLAEGASAAESEDLDAVAGIVDPESEEVPTGSAAADGAGPELSDPSAFDAAALSGPSGEEIADADTLWTALGSNSETFGVSEIIEESRLEFRGTSTVKAGTLVLLIDGTEVHSMELLSVSRGAKRFFKKIAGKAAEAIDFSITVTAGEHEIVARLQELGESFVYESRLTVEAEPDAEVPLRIVASRSGKRRLILELDEPEPEFTSGPGPEPEIAQLDF
jgi:DNA-binding response OmpR family regulator